MSGFSNDSDNLLVLRLREDKVARGAFTELYNRYWKRLLVQALHKLQDETEAEEVVQEVFMNLWKRRSSLDIRNTFHTYIASSVKYEVLARLAKRKAKEAFEKTAGRLYAVADDQTSLQMDYEATRRKLEETVQGLPEKCQLVFRLSREAGLSEKQIAEQMNISTKTVEAHMSKALKALRNALQQLFCWL